MHPETSPDDPDLGELLGRLLPVLLEIEAPILESAELSMWEYVILSALARSTSTSQAELSRRVGRDPTRLGGHLSDLETRGYVTRARSGDRRRHALSLSTTGRAALIATKARVRAAEDELLESRLGAAKGRQMRELLRGLAGDSVEASETE